MSDSDNTQDSAAMSPASNGSVAKRRELRVPDWRGVPVDLWIDSDGDFGLMDEESQESLVIHGKAIPAIAEWLGGFTLTCAEREALERLCEATSDMIDDDKRAGGCHWQDDAAAVAVVRGLLERFK